MSNLREVLTKLEEAVQVLDGMTVEHGADGYAVEDLNNEADMAHMFIRDAVWALDRAHAKVCNLLLTVERQ